MLAGIPNAPSVYAPTVNKKLANKRTKQVIMKMVEYKYLKLEKKQTKFLDSSDEVSNIKTLKLKIKRIYAIMLT